MNELLKRKYKINMDWFLPTHTEKGKELYNKAFNYKYLCNQDYPEHNDTYLQECLDNLANKGIYIDLEKQITYFNPKHKVNGFLKNGKLQIYR